MSDRFQHKNLYLTACALILVLGLYSPSGAADLSAYRGIPEKTRELLDRGESFCARSGTLSYMTKDGCLGTLSLLRGSLENSEPASYKPDEDPMRRWNEFDNRCRTLFANLHDNKGCRDLGKYIHGLSPEQDPKAQERTNLSQRGAILSSLEPGLKLDRPKPGRYPSPPKAPSHAAQASPASQALLPAETPASQPAPAVEPAPPALAPEPPVLVDTKTTAPPGTAKIPAAPENVPPAFIPAPGISETPALPGTDALPPASTSPSPASPAPEAAKTPALPGASGMSGAPETPSISALPGTDEVPPSLTRTMPEIPGMPAPPSPAPGTLFQSGAATSPQGGTAFSPGPEASMLPAQNPAPPAIEGARNLDAPSAFSTMEPPTVVPYSPDSGIPSWPTTIPSMTLETLPPIPLAGRVNSGGAPQTVDNMPNSTEERQSALSAAAAATGNNGQATPAASGSPDSFADIIPNFVPPPPPVPTQNTPMPAGQSVR
ncbi:MAG: hypothetical protein FWG17_06945 [Desulfovibrionaceae bacterium]|nr:hypothetical protein [Desulfovibrionaceae bacterium]